VTQRPPWTVFRAALEARGFRPSRRLGQNFLLDENMVRAIVRDAEISAGDFVLEIGAGCGFLSLHLLDAGAKLVCVEIDERLLPIAAGLVAGHGSAQFIRCDVLDGKHALAAEVASALPAEGPWHLVSNLPYAIAGPVLAVLGSHARPPETMTVLVQREVADRIAASPDTPEWGPLSIRLQVRYAPRIVRSVPPDLFWPRPRVESAVVRLERRKDPGEPEVLRRFDTLVGELFSSRRQSLGRVLARRFGDREASLSVLREAGLEPRLRAEALDLDALLRLARLLE
jgi:16S rRNA (adenine1518-N6/adenine1519-N6)-dimethyltransferase